ncbi:dipeptide/oligopeptide/nickel ABC transporter permease/ATP-binding protein [uncultured Microbacterium sp.]|uniref:ABC transporter n=1 Tax=uncultured Microbacterium sp. TaxID=191216 RepID=A0A1Y5P7Z9_9MICO|nr:dipeptide/oligopeptide/nickel ABC transporter permease/ATP-binding protein [uncultured Microbacterium sp.]SBS72191.1 ABC transporter [uncultured Microbacterium sp.]
MSTTVTLDVAASADAASAPRAGAFTKLVRTPLGLGSLIVLAGIVILGLLEPVLSTHAPEFVSLDHVNASPGTPGYPFGADQYGRDIFTRVLASINVSVISGLIGAGVAVVLGTVFGLLAGYVGRRTDSVTSWIFNLLMTFPALVLVIVLYPVTGGTYQGMMVIFGVFLAPGVYRVVRNEVVGVRNELYIDAARVAGLSDRRILSRHVLYVVRGPIIITAAFLTSAAIGVQSGLAFLGFGDPQIPSFGAMTGAAFANIYVFPVQMVWPSVFLALLSGGLVLLGNAYRDALSGAPTGPTARRRPIGAEEAEAPAEPSLPRSAEPSLLAVRGLQVRYPQTDGSMKSVVEGVSLDVRPGEIVGLVGESGSGKSQTAFSVLGLLPKDAQVTADVLEIAGTSLLGKGAAARRRMRGGVIAYVPQEPMSNLDPSFTVGRQLMEGLTPAMSRKEAKATILALFARVGLVDPERTFRSYPHEISGGMAQRALIAGAVMTRPKLLIADEPTTALDVTVQAEILDLLRDLQGEMGMGVLIVTHNFGVVADLCDRVIVMRAGQIVESGEVRDIFHRPQHPYTRELIASILDEETLRTDPLPISAKEEDR